MNPPVPGKDHWMRKANYKTRGGAQSLTQDDIERGKIRRACEAIEDYKRLEAEMKEVWS
jgi:hypothetical protein